MLKDHQAHTAVQVDKPRSTKQSIMARGRWEQPACHRQLP